MPLLDFLKKKRTNEKSRAKADAARPPAEKKAERKQGAAGFKAKNEISERAFEVLLAPQVTEKTSSLNALGVYVFRIADGANKKEIGRAVRELYGVRPRKINLIKTPAKTRWSRGKKGLRPGYKKALVFLNPGETIEIT
ncbi:50S ribosomal protein L23 [Candidatus Giovannonibacteria bacterium]|nr:50S ribosomal protein L23 [Candidatus Giovannonibacteria bacterium]